MAVVAARVVLVVAAAKVVVVAKAVEAATVARASQVPAAVAVMAATVPAVVVAMEDTVPVVVVAMAALASTELVDAEGPVAVVDTELGAAEELEDPVDLASVVAVAMVAEPVAVAAAHREAWGCPVRGFPAVLLPC